METKLCMEDVLICCPYCGKLLTLPSPNKEKISKSISFFGLRVSTAKCADCHKEFYCWQRFEKGPPPGYWDRRYCTYIEFEAERKGNSIIASCSACGKALTLSLPKGKRKRYRSGYERTGAECRPTGDKPCTSKFSYWGWILPRGDGGNRWYKIRFKIPELAQQILMWQHKIDTEKNWVKFPKAQTDSEEPAKPEPEVLGI
jgi:hypothetical protein